MAPPELSSIRTRTVSRIALQRDTRPAWREAMTSTDTLYYNTAAPMNQPINTLVWPGGVQPTHYGEKGNTGAAWDCLTGFSSQVLLEDVGGPHGVVVWGTGGHTRLQNQLLGCDLNLDQPTMFWYQQPRYRTSAVDGAELYFNPIDAATFPPDRIIPTSESVAGWSGQFPVAFTGWIYPDKMVTGQMGGSAPHGFRYSNACFVPASMTGTGRSAYFLTPGPQGPFGLSYKPAGEADSRWFKPEALWQSGRRKWPYYFMDTETRQWSEHKWLNDLAVYDFEMRTVFVFRDIKRIYMSECRAGGSSGWSYIDMTKGIAGDVVMTRVEISASGYGDKSIGAAHTDRHPQGKHLAYFRSLLGGTDKLFMQDFDGLNHHVIAVAGLDFSAPRWDRRAITYDPVHNRLLVVVRDKASFAIGYYSIPIPDDHIKGSYVATFRQLAASDPAGMAASQASMSYWYGVRMHPTLGSILLPSHSARGLGFVPRDP